MREYKMKPEAFEITYHSEYITDFNTVIQWCNKELDFKNCAQQNLAQTLEYDGDHLRGASSLGFKEYILAIDTFIRETNNNTHISLPIFKGKLTYTVINNETESSFELAAMTGRKEPFSRYLNTKAEYTISGDTLILEKYDEYNELYFVNIQIGSNIWTGTNYSGNESNFAELKNVSHFDIDMCLIDNWNETEFGESENMDIKSYSGQAIQNDITEYEIKVISHEEISKQKNFNGLFCKVFCKYGLIVESFRTFRNKTTEMKLQEKVENTSINCRQKLSKYTFGG